jgi:hypothetical protein
MAILLADPYAIFAQARERWESARYPSQLAYDVVVSVTHRGTASTSHYHLYYDSRANSVKVNAVSDEELAHPYTPHGINTFFNFFGGAIPMSAPQHTFDFLGVPILAPNYSFGIAPYIAASSSIDSAELVREIRREFHDPPKPGTPAAANSPLKTIASVDVVRRHYVIELNGTTLVDAHQDYDLRLRPVRDPGAYRLREVWIDTQTFATDRLISQGNFVHSGMTGVPWTVTFRQLDGAPYIASESTAQSFTLDRSAYDSASVSFENVRATRLPGYVDLMGFGGADTLTEPLAP